MATGRLDDLIETLESEFYERQPRSAELTQRARPVLAGGANSNRQMRMAQAMWVTHGAGSRVWDVDGNEYVDLHGGHGAMLVGHGHPRVVEAVAERVALGTHFGEPTEDAIVVAGELARRFGLPLWRFCNSGTEATHDAVRMMRAYTGRKKIIKAEGCYHGHNDSVMVAAANTLDELGPAERPASPQSGAGLLQEITDLTIVVPWNDAAQLERRLDEERGQIAGVILEPIPMNMGMVLPDPGYVESVRELTRQHGALLVFDEIKTGLTVDPGGATALLGVEPDIVCLGKAFGAGLSCGAIGGTDSVMDMIATGAYEQIGTYNGNPLLMAAARAGLCDVLDEFAYAHVGALQRRLVNGCREVIEEYGLPATVQSVGAKGYVGFAPRVMHNYREFLGLDQRFGHCHWLFQHNHGVFLPPWAAGQPWLISVQHTEDDVELCAANFRKFASVLRDTAALV